MNLFKKLFWNPKTTDLKSGQPSFNLGELLDATDQNGSIIAIDDYICGLCIHGDDLSHLSQPQRDFHYIQELEREVNNGGFYQYFFNSSGDTANEVVKALKAIGANRTAEIVQKALDQFPDKEVPRYRNARQHILEQIEELADPVWEDLSQQFFEYNDELNELNIQYIKANRNSF